MCSVSSWSGFGWLTMFVKTASHCRINRIATHMLMKTVALSILHATFVWLKAILLQMRTIYVTVDQLSKESWPFGSLALTHTLRHLPSDVRRVPTSVLRPCTLRICFQNRINPNNTPRRIFLLIARRALFLDELAHTRTLPNWGVCARIYCLIFAAQYQLGKVVRVSVVLGFYPPPQM